MQAVLVAFVTVLAAIIIAGLALWYAGYGIHRLIEWLRNKPDAITLEPPAIPEVPCVCGHMPTDHYTIGDLPVESASRCLPLCWCELYIPDPDGSVLEMYVRKCIARSLPVLALITESDVRSWNIPESDQESIRDMVKRSLEP